MSIVHDAGTYKLNRKKSNYKSYLYKIAGDGHMHNIQAIKEKKKSSITAGSSLKSTEALPSQKLEIKQARMI